MSMSVKKEQGILIALSCLLLLTGWFLNLGAFPFKLEEPRRALVALEMILNDDFIVPTINNEPYYKKPPMFNWVLIGSFHLFGDYSEFAARFVTVLSFIVMVALLGWAGAKYVNKEFGWLLALLTATCVDFLFYATIYAEIDVFYSLVTITGFLGLFHFHKRRNYFALFLWVYFFGALGTLTKSLPSVAFIACSLPAYLWYKKDLKQLFSFSHLLGVMVYVTIVGAYLFLYEKRHSLEPLLQSLFYDSSERTLVQQHWTSLLGHLVNYPLTVLKGTLPGSLLLIFVIRKRRDVVSTWKENPLIAFAVILLAANFWLYWISPGSRLRYVFMLFPFVLAIGLFFYQKFHAVDHRRLYFFRLFTRILIALSGLACLALPFVPGVKELPGIIVISILSAAGVAALFGYQYIRPVHSLFSMILLAAWLRIVFDLTVLSVRGTDSDSQRWKDIAYRVAELTKGNPLYVTRADNMHMLIPFYLTQQGQGILNYRPDFEYGGYYLVDKGSVPQEQFNVHYDFSVHGRDYLIVTLKPGNDDV